MPRFHPGLLDLTYRGKRLRMGILETFPSRFWDTHPWSISWSLACGRHTRVHSIECQMSCSSASSKTPGFPPTPLVQPEKKNLRELGFHLNPFLEPRNHRHGGALWGFGPTLSEIDFLLGESIRGRNCVLFILALQGHAWSWHFRSTYKGVMKVQVTNSYNSLCPSGLCTESWEALSKASRQNDT